VADEVVGDAAIDRQRVVEALVALDEFLDRRGRPAPRLSRADVLVLLLAVRPERARGAGCGARLDD
jgi:hypothetical protein